MRPRAVFPLLLFLLALPCLPGCRGAHEHPPNVLAAGGTAVTAASGQQQGQGPEGAGKSGEAAPAAEARAPGAAGSCAAPAEGVSASEPLLFVYVSGAVAKPGVYRLPSDARGCDALAAAGGAVKDARLELVNLAAPLADGQQLHIPSRAEAGGYVKPLPGSANRTPEVRGPVNVNRATVAELMELPGIGAVLAGRIVAYRSDHGLFTQADDLLAVSGIGESRLKDLKPLITTGP